MLVRWRVCHGRSITVLVTSWQAWNSQHVKVNPWKGNKRTCWGLLTGSVKVAHLGCHVVLCAYSFFKIIFYWLCYYSCPDFSPSVPLHPATPAPWRNCSYPWVMCIRSSASPFPMAACLFLNYRMATILWLLQIECPVCKFLRNRGAQQSLFVCFIIFFKHTRGSLTLWVKK